MVFKVRFVILILWLLLVYCLQFFLAEALSKKKKKEINRWVDKICFQKYIPFSVYLTKSVIYMGSLVFQLIQFDLSISKLAIVQTKMRLLHWSGLILVYTVCSHFLLNFRDDTVALSSWNNWPLFSPSSKASYFSNWIFKPAGNINFAIRNQ